jgi:signal peptidase II
MRRNNGRFFWPVFLLVVAVDFFTKSLASRMDEGVPRELHASWARLTLVHNQGAAFGLYVGEHSRWIFMVLTIIALVILARLYSATRNGDIIRSVSLALVCGGAVGNLIDRIASAKGVIDFIDIGIGESRWPTFNVADMAVSIGAFLLAWVLWGEDTESETVGVATPATVPGADTREVS